MSGLVHTTRAPKTEKFDHAATPDPNPLEGGNLALIALPEPASHTSGGYESRCAGLVRSHTQRKISLVGAPVELGAGVRGCSLGPDFLRAVGIVEALAELGHDVEDLGNLALLDNERSELPGRANHAGNIIAWTRVLSAGIYDVLRAGRLPLCLGGDHALAMGTVTAAARHANDQRRPLCVLWLDAHADANTPATSISGNMHGMPVAFLCNEPGFDSVLDPPRPTVDPTNVFMLGLRSVDAPERQLLATRGINAFDMRTIDEGGIGTIMANVLDRIESIGAMLHVSLDADFLDPSIAPGVGTAVAGGVSQREARLVMEMLSGSPLLSSVDIVELNPLLDDQGKSARLIAELAATIFGRKVLSGAAGRMRLPMADTVSPLAKMVREPVTVRETSGPLSDLL